MEQAAGSQQRGNVSGAISLPSVPSTSAQSLLAEDVPPQGRDELRLPLAIHPQ